jgi:4-amino-4-deoxy-L-arabinose transferase-like glycosyltransferase
MIHQSWSVVKKRSDVVHYLLLTLVLVVAAAARIGCLADLWNTPVTQVPVIDSEYYHVWAQELARGGERGSGVFFMSPLYPYLLSVLYRLFGAEIHIVLLLQAFAGIALVYLIYRLGLRLFSRAIGLISAFIAALYQPFIYYENMLLSAILILLLNAAALLLLLKEKPEKVHIFLAGLLLGLSALARPNVLIFVAVLSLFLMYNAFRRRSQSGADGIIRPLMLLLGVLVILTPVLYRNLRVSGDWVLTTAGFGMNFYAGNNPDAEGIYWEAPFIRSAEPQFENEDYRLEASRRTGKNLSVNQTSRYWFTQGIHYIVSNPLDYLKLQLTKLFLFFHRTEIPNNLSIYCVRDFSTWLPGIPFVFGIIAPFGFAWWLRGINNMKLAIAHLYGLSYLLGTLLFFAASEYRLPVLLVLIPFAAAGFLDLLKNVKHRRWKSFAAQFLLTVFFALPVNMSTAFTDSIASPRMDYFNLGSVLLKQNRNAEAAAMLQRALFINPHFKEAHIALGDAYHALGQYDQAAEEFRRGGLDPESELRILNAEELFTEADSQAMFGDYEGAYQNYRNGIAGHPNPPVYAYYNLAFLSLQLGDTTRALEEAKTAVELFPEEPKVHYLQGWIEENLGDWDTAFRAYQRALELNPVFHLARARAALTSLKKGDRERAARLIEPLLGVHLKNPELKELVNNIAEQVGY